MLELSEDEANSPEHLDSQVQKAQEQLLQLKRQQEQIEKQKRELEELERRLCHERRPDRRTNVERVQKQEQLEDEQRLRCSLDHRHARDSRR